MSNYETSTDLGAGWLEVLAPRRALINMRQVICFRVDQTARGDYTIGVYTTVPVLNVAIGTWPTEELANKGLEELLIQRLSLERP